MTASARALSTSTLFVIALLAAPSVASAQHIGVKGGLNFATLAISPTPVVPFYQSRTGPLVGLFFTSNGGQRVGLLWELLYTQKGASAIAPVTGALRLEYAELPFMARILVANGNGFRAHVNAGIAADYLLTAKAVGGGVTTGITRQFERTDFGVVFGGSVALANLLVDVRYDLGLRNIAKNSGSTSIKTKTLSISAGIWF